MGKRRGVRCYGLAWVPVAQLWVMGSLADGFDNVTKRKNMNLRLIMLFVGLGAFVLGLTIIMLSVAMIAIVVLSVFEYIALFKIYNSCKDKDNIVIFVLSMFLPIIIPFVLFSFRNSDDGFPFMKKKKEEASKIDKKELNEGSQFESVNMQEPPYVKRDPVYSHPKPITVTGEPIVNDEPIIVEPTVNDEPIIVEPIVNDEPIIVEPNEIIYSEDPKSDADYAKPFTEDVPPIYGNNDVPPYKG